MWGWLFLRAGFASFSSCMNSTDIVFCTRFVTIPFSHKLRLQIQLQSQYNIRQRSKYVLPWIAARTLHALAASAYWRLLVLFTRCKLAGTSQLPVMRAQAFHANRIMEDATRLEVKPFEISITFMKRLWARIPQLFMFVNLFQMAFSVKRIARDGNSLFRILAILLENCSYYFMLRYLIGYAETVLCSADYSHKIRLNSTCICTSTLINSGIFKTDCIAIFVDRNLNLTFLAYEKPIFSSTFPFFSVLTLSLY